MRLPSRLVPALALAAGLSLASATASASSAFAQCRHAPVVQFPGTIVDAAVATPALSALTQLVVAAGLAGPLSAPGNLTVFAPTNDAFAKIPAGVLGAIGGDPAVLTAVLTYHVVAGPADPRGAVKREVTTLQGQTLNIGYSRSGGGGGVNQSVAGCTAVKSTNGTVWVIDSVLLPQFR